MRLRLLAVAAVLCIAPATAVEVEIDGELTLTGDFTSLTLTFTMSMGGPEAAQMRTSIDESADNDGFVTQAEVDAFMAQAGPFLQSGLSEKFESDDLQLDGNNAKSVSVQDFDLARVPGATTSTDPIDMIIAIKAGLEPEGTGKHTLVMKGEEDSTSEPPDMEGEFRIKAPSGYVIESHNAGAGAELSSDKRMLTLTPQDMEDSSDEGKIVFAPASSGKGSPAPGVAVLASVLAVAVAIRRRD